MDYKEKQQWIEAVMASDLTPATKVYAFGIYKHMYGNKDESFPGATPLAEATGLNDSQFYRYNTALKSAGYLEVTPGEGRSNHYRLLLPTSVEGTYLPHVEVYLPSDEVAPTSTEGTNTTRNTTMKTSKENIKGDEDSYSLSSSDLVLQPSLNLGAFNYVVTPKGVTKQANLPSDEVGSQDYEKGEQYLERMLTKHGITGTARSTARARYADEDYEPTITGTFRAAHLIREAMGMKLVDA